MHGHLAPLAALIGMALLAACSQPAEAPVGEGRLAFIAECTVLESRKVSVSLPASGNGRIIGGVGGGIAGTLLGPVGTATGAAAGAAAGETADRLLSRSSGVEYTVLRADGVQLSVLQAREEGEPVLAPDTPCRIRTDATAGTARVLPPLPTT